MQKQCLNQLTNLKYFIQAYLELFIRIYIFRLNRRIMIVLKTLFKHFGLDETQYSITPANPTGKALYLLNGRKKRLSNMTATE